MSSYLLSELAIRPAVGLLQTFVLLGAQSGKVEMVGGVQGCKSKHFLQKNNTLITVFSLQILKDVVVLIFSTLTKTAKISKGLENPSNRKL